MEYKRAYTIDVKKLMGMALAG